jgi:hypothetical protein
LAVRDVKQRVIGGYIVGSRKKMPAAGPDCAEMREAVAAMDGVARAVDRLLETGVVGICRRRRI